MRFNFIIIILVIKGSTDSRSEFSIKTPLRASNRMRGKVLTKWLLSSSYLTLLMYDKFNYLQSVSARNMFGFK